MKLSTLKRRAQQSTRLRGHRMRWNEPFGRANGPKSQFGFCRVCNAEVLLCEKPAPNGIDIGGAAVAVHCPIANL